MDIYVLHELKRGKERLLVFSSMEGVSSYLTNEGVGHIEAGGSMYLAFDHSYTLSSATV